jgi:DNA-binding transcriptional LysR family regulator
MHLETLKIFCDVVRHESFSRGASANDVSQSAASQAVHQLEKRLGTLLIDRSKRPWVLTSQGRIFFEGCQDVLTRFQELEDSIGNHCTTDCEVRVAAIYSVGLHNMAQYVDRFRAAHAGVDVAIEYMHPDEVYKHVLEGKADLGLISFASRAREFTAVPWREEEMVVACLPEHRFALEGEIRPRDLHGERFIRFAAGLPIRRAMDRFLRRHRVQVEVVADFDNIHTIKQAVEEGAGVSILPAPTLRREMEQGVLAAVPFARKPFFRPLSIIRRRAQKLSGAATAFSDFISNGHRNVAEAAGGKAENGTMDGSHPGERPPRGSRRDSRRKVEEP